MSKISDVIFTDPLTGYSYGFSNEEMEVTGDLLATGNAYFFGLNQMGQINVHVAKAVLDTYGAAETAPNTYDVTLTMNSIVQHFTIVLNNQPPNSSYYYGSITYPTSGETLNFLYTDYAPIPVLLVLAAIAGVVLLVCIGLVLIPTRLSACIASAKATCGSMGKKVKSVKYESTMASPTQGCTAKCSFTCG